MPFEQVTIDACLKLAHNIYQDLARNEELGLAGYCSTERDLSYYIPCMAPAPLDGGFLEPCDIPSWLISHPEANVLDLGCGAGNALKELQHDPKKLWGVAATAAFNFGEGATQIDSQRYVDGTGINFLAMDMYKALQMFDSDGLRFGLVLSNEGFKYVPNPLELLQATLNNMLPGSPLFIGGFAVGSHETILDTGMTHCMVFDSRGNRLSPWEFFRYLEEINPGFYFEINEDEIGRVVRRQPGTGDYMTGVPNNYGSLDDHRANVSKVSRIRFNLQSELLDPGLEPGKKASNEEGVKQLGIYLEELSNFSSLGFLSVSASKSTNDPLQIPVARLVYHGNLVYQLIDPEYKAQRPLNYEIATLDYLTRLLDSK